MTRILSNLHYSVRSFARTPGTTFALLLTIALGFGSSFAVQGFVEGLTKPDPSLPKGLVSLLSQDRHRSGGPLSYDEYRSIRASNKDAFEWLGLARVSRMNVALRGNAAKSERMTVAAVTKDLADALVVGHEGLYRNRPIDKWMPLDEKSIAENERRIRNCWVIGKLRAGAVLALDGRFQMLPYTGLTPEAAEGYRRVGILLRVAAAFVFFIACTNVASILIGRSLARSREITLRVALGASRWQLVGALLSDCFVICIAGCTMGAVLARWTLQVVPALLFEQDAGSLVFAPNISGLIEVTLGWIMVLILCGLLPMLVTPHDRPAAVLQRENAGPSRAVGRLRSALVIAQMACCCILAISTGFLFATFQAAVQTNRAKRGAERTILATVQANPDFGTLRYFRDVENAVRALPFVKASGMPWAVRLPGSEPAMQAFRVDMPVEAAREVVMDRSVFTAALLDALRLPPTAGRMFSGLADHGRRVAIVNESAALLLYGPRETAGRLIWDSHGLAVEIVGVVASHIARPAIWYFSDAASGTATFRISDSGPLPQAELDANVVSADYFAAMDWPLLAGRGFVSVGSDARERVAVVNQEAVDLYFGGNATAAVGAAVIDETGRRTAIVGVVQAPPLGIFDRLGAPGIYFPVTQDALPRMTVMFDVNGAVNSEMLKDVRTAVAPLPGRGPAPLIVKTLETHIGQTALAPLRIAAAIVGAFSVTGLFLSILGLFGALQDSARQRSRELAVRVALGAQRRHMVLLILSEGVRLAAAGSIAGIVGALLLSKFLPRITPGESLPALWFWLAGPVALMMAVAVASIRPARGAVMADPLRVMRSADGGS